MPSRDELTFFLYRDGYQPQELYLGHLVFDFLFHQVLAAESTRETVRKWLSVSTHEYIIRKLAPVLWRPKIWMLTGVYEFDDCTSFTWETSNKSGEVGVASEILALLGVPLGMGMTVNVGRGQYRKQTFPGTAIWAAQYQLIDPEYLHVGSGERHKQPPEPAQLRLRLKEIYSVKGAVFRAGRGKSSALRKEIDEREPKPEKVDPNNTAVVHLAGELSTAQGDASEWEEEFWDRYGEAEKEWAAAKDAKE
ncbi:hypothetical protein N656DRAFT_825975 [Canariomyces notabilis]|uniref:Uncharacterized protein n=1 Tax=Canariomyces notabilis TaxID=2074819 RepID=A0AAN6YWF8_9PEZI|nr:hypothetical protein N656DRAFT_825975 [Canariomyces arenarius]